LCGTVQAWQGLGAPGGGRAGPGSQGRPRAAGTTPAPGPQHLSGDGQRPGWDFRVA